MSAAELWKSNVVGEASLPVRRAGLSAVPQHQARAPPACPALDPNPLHTHSKPFLLCAASSCPLWALTSMHCGECSENASAQLGA